MNYLVLFQTLIASIKAVEQLMPQSPGKDKAAAVIAMIEGVLGSVQPMLPALQEIIAVVVAGLNAAGVFTKKAA